MGAHSFRDAIDRQEAVDYYGLDDGDDYDRLSLFCADCGDPAETCECSGYEPEHDFSDPTDTGSDYEGDRYIGGGGRDMYPHMSDRDYQDCRDAGRVI